MRLRPTPQTQPPALTQVGDTLQSSASRMSEYITGLTPPAKVPYEVRMAALEANRAVADWTAVRRKARSSNR